MNFKTLYYLFIEKARKLLQDALLIKQLFKFSFVGVLNTIVGYGAFWILLTWCNYMVSLVIAHIIGVTHSYIWNKYWTFKTKKIEIKEFVKFNSVYLIVFADNAIFLFFLVDTLKFNPRIGQLLALPLITIISFTGHKYWSFTGK